MVEQAAVETSETSDATQEAVLPEWMNEPEHAELIADESNKNILSFYKEKNDLPKALVEKEKLLRSAFRLPKKLNDEQITELSGRIAEVNKVPENAEGYELVMPEEIDKSFDLSEKAKMAIRAYAKENKWSPKSLQGVYEMAVRLGSESQDTANQTFAEATKTRNTGNCFTRPFVYFQNIYSASSLWPSITLTTIITRKFPIFLKINLNYIYILLFITKYIM